MIKLNITRFGSANKTTHYELSQFVSSDKPSWLNDINSDMSKIDTAINTAKTTADGAATAAGNAATAAEGAQNTANTAITNAATADGKAVQAQNNIGTMANLTTSEKTTLVGAINEIDGDVGNLGSLDTTAKTNLVAAINELVSVLSTKENSPTVLWNNSSPSTSMSSTSLTLNDALANYDYFEIICLRVAGDIHYLTSGVIPAANARIIGVDAGNVVWRDFEASGTNKINVGDGKIPGGTNNNILVPLEILGYKKN